MARTGRTRKDRTSLTPPIDTPRRRRLLRRPIRTFWWEHRDPTIRNFGDALNLPLLHRLTGRRIEWTPIDRCDLVAIGSILELVFEAQRTTPIHIWGSGFVREGDRESGAAVHVGALRGPLSAARLAPEGTTLGDPGLLCDFLLDRRPGTRFGLGVIPHYVDLDDSLVEAYRAEPGDHTVISPLLPPHEFVARVAQCETVVASCLHGMITADALGIPNAWTELSDRVVGSGYKFRDYLANYGITEVVPVSLPPPSRSASFAESIGNQWQRPGIDDIRSGLLASFPPL